MSHSTNTYTSVSVLSEQGGARVLTGQAGQVTHPPDGHQDATVGVDHEQEWQQEAEDEEAHHVGDTGWRALVPLYRAGGTGALQAIAAPAQERRHGPQQGIEPGAGYTQPGLAEVGQIGLGATQHGGVALVRQHGQRHQGHDALDGWMEREKWDEVGGGGVWGVARESGKLRIA